MYFCFSQSADRFNFNVLDKTVPNSEHTRTQLLTVGHMSVHDLWTNQVSHHRGLILNHLKQTFIRVRTVKWAKRLGSERESGRNDSRANGKVGKLTLISFFYSCFLV